MAKNLEIKCRIDNFNSVKRKFAGIDGIIFLSEKQTDVYYKVKNGRLKLRIINDEKGNLIFYKRAEKTSKRISNYIISETVSFRELNLILQSQFEVLTTVQKKREIYLDRNIRIHLDTVKGLGKFLEIEVIYKDLIKAKKQMKDLINTLDLNEKDFIRKSYSDLLINKK